MSEIRFEYKGQKYSIKGSNFYTANGDLIRDKQMIRSLISAKNQWSSKPVGADNDTVDAKTVIDGQQFTEIETTTGSQSEINKFIDQDLKDKTDAITEAQQDIALLKNQGGDRGYVLCAYSSDAVIQSIARSPEIINGGSGYKESDVVFVNIESDTIFVKAWAIVGSVDSNGGITSFQLNDKGQISSVGAYQGIEATENLNTFTTGEGTGAVVSITIEEVSGSTSNIASIEDPKPGNTVIVLQDETAHNAMYKYIYADKNGDGIFNWIPLTKIEQMPLVGDGDIIQIENGVITTNSTNLSNFCSVNGNITYKPLKNIPGLQDIEVISLDNDHLNYAIETITYGSIELYNEDSPLRLFVGGDEVKQGNTKSQSTWVYVPVLNNDGTHKQLGGNDVYFIQNKETQKYIKLNSNTYYVDPFQFAPLDLVDSVDASEDACQFMIYDESDVNNPGKHKLVSIKNYDGDDLYTELHSGTLFVIGNSVLAEQNTDEAVAIHFQADQFNNKNLSVTLSHENCKIITKRYVVDNKVIDADHPTEGTITIDGSRFYSDHTKVLLYVMPAETQYNPNIAVKCIDKDGKPAVHQDYACDKGYKFYYTSYDYSTYEVVPFSDVKNDSDIFENNVVTEEFNMKFDDVLKIYIDHVKQVELGQYGLEVADHTGNLLLHTSKSDTKIYDGEGHIMMSHEGPNPNDTFQLVTGLLNLYSTGNRLTANNNCIVPAYKIVEFTEAEYQQLYTDYPSGLPSSYLLNNPFVRISRVNDDLNSASNRSSLDDGTYTFLCFSSLATTDFNSDISERSYVMINTYMPYRNTSSSIYNYKNRLKFYHLIDLFGNPTSEVRLQSRIFQMESNRKSTYMALWLYGMPVFYAERLWNGMSSCALIGQNGYSNFGSITRLVSGSSTNQNRDGSFYINRSQTATPGSSSNQNYYFSYYPSCTNEYFNTLDDNKIAYTYWAGKAPHIGNIGGTGQEWVTTDENTATIEKTIGGYTALFNGEIQGLTRDFLSSLCYNFSSGTQALVYLPDSLTSVGNYVFGQDGSMSSKVYGVFANNIKEIGEYSFTSTELRFFQLNKGIQYLPSHSIGNSGTIDIFYNGTIADFDNIEKANDWKNGTGKIYVNAIDGRKLY